MKLEAKVYVEFVENHLPQLKAGAYQLRGIQSLANGHSNEQYFQANLPGLNFAVGGERFIFKPSDINSVFPPRNSLGHYAHALPHIVLNKATLPWERNLAEKNDDTLEKTPWLALLVLREDELLTAAGSEPTSVQEYQEAGLGYTKKIEELPTDPVQNNCWPPSPHPWEKEQDKARVIYLKPAAAKTVVPTAKDLYWLAHLRKSKIKVSGCNYDAFAIVIRDEEERIIHDQEFYNVTTSVSIDLGEIPPGKYFCEVKNVEGSRVPFFLEPSDRIGSTSTLVVANRLPQAGKKSIVHLVSLENRFKESEDGQYVLDYDETKPVPFISLHSWSFTALTEKETFRNIALHLNSPFRFGIHRPEPKHAISIDDFRSHFAGAKIVLSQSAQIIAQSAYCLRDNHQIYYFDAAGNAYNFAGRLILTGTEPVTEKDKAIGKFSEDTFNTRFVEWKENKSCYWISDGNKRYFCGYDVDTERMNVYEAPGDEGGVTLRLPEREAPSHYVTADESFVQEDLNKANAFLHQGFVPLLHQFRRGDKNISWYRSPLLPGEPTKHIDFTQFPVATGDQLLRYDKDYGMFDTSYAAAWELGRLLCLKEKSVAVELYRWKRQHVRGFKAMEQQHLRPHLPFKETPADLIQLPPRVEAWFNGLRGLKGVPFRYLVPDAKMLPSESLRFFYLDPSWVASLVDGALSIGRVPHRHDEVVDKVSLTDTAPVEEGEIFTGFILRSQLLPGWPDLVVKAFGANMEGDPTTELHALRLEKLSEDTLLGIFQGELIRLDLSERLEQIHLGFSPQHNQEGYLKYPRTAEGEETGQPLKPTANNPFYDGNSRVIKADVLAGYLRDFPNLEFTEPFTSAQFALSMTEGVSRVKFTY